MTAGVVHIAAAPVEVGNQLRQRCGWCGAMLLDYDLCNLGIHVGDDRRPPMWGPGELVSVNGGASFVVEHIDGDDVPSNCCAAVDPAVTGLVAPSTDDDDAAGAPRT